MPRSWKVNEATIAAIEWKTTRKSGWLTKMGGGSTPLFGRKSWKQRWFVLKAGVLSYSEDEHSEQLGVLDLKGAILEDVTSKENGYEFDITVKKPEKRTYCIRCVNKSEFNAWYDVIARVIKSLAARHGPDMLLEVDLDGLRLIDPQTDKAVDFWKLSKIRNWKPTADGYFCFCANVNKEPRNYMFKTPECGDIAKTLNKAAKEYTKGNFSKTLRGTSHLTHAPAVPEARDTLLRSESYEQKSYEKDSKQDVATMARALYDYTPTDADRMPLQRGELVRVTKIVSDDWWRAVGQTGAKGLVPRVYLRPCLQEVVARATNDFNDGKKKHLKLTAGEKVVILTRVGDSDWYGAVGGSDGAVGIVPITYVEIIQGKETFDLMQQGAIV